MTRAVLFGVGETARYCARYLQDKGADIVGVFSRTSGVGENAGRYLGLRRPTGTTVSNDPILNLGKCRADFAVLATQSSIASQLPLVRLCVDHGLDVLSLAEEGFYPSSAETRAAIEELDAVALAGGKTVFFGGIQDVLWYNTLLVLSGGCQTITRINGRSVADIDELGPATAAEFPLGLSAEEFRQATADNANAAEFHVMGPTVEAVLGRFSLDVVARRRWIEPVFAKKALHCRSLGTMIDGGLTCGVSEYSTFETAQGVTVNTEFSTRIYEDGGQPPVSWSIKGEPDLEITYGRFPGSEATAACLVNRVPDVLAASPGYKTVLDLPAPHWWRGFPGP